MKNPLLAYFAAAFSVVGVVFQCTAAVSAQAIAPPVLVENFTYPAGSLLTVNGWSAHSGAGTNSIAVSASGLTYPGYASSGFGNAASLTTSGEDVNRPLAGTINSGSVYASALINVSASQVTGDYFFHLYQGSTTFYCRLFVRKDAASNNYAIGIAKSSGTATYTATSDFVPGTTYLVVVKYTFNAGSTTDDTVGLFINPVVGAAEPSPTLVPDNTPADSTGLGGIALRQGTAANAATVQVDGIRVGRTWASVTGPTRALANAPMDINGDGRTDYSIVRPAGGAGSQLTWYTQLNGGNPYPNREWGISGDQALAGDYDGDGQDDITIFRASNSTFYTIHTGTLTMRIEQFGQTGDDARVVEDYDGDGRDDLAVYRPGSPGTWYYKTASSVTFNSVPWGDTGDLPAAGDYDGDGVADFVVWRRLSGSQQFWKRLATGEQSTIVFGTDHEGIAPGDYDGDGKTDLCVFKTSGGFYVWDFEPSGTAGVTVVSDTWGIPGDIVVPGDYDGDGKSDYAIWRPGTQGVFWVMTVGDRRIFTKEWGQTGDVPVAGFGALRP